MYEPQNDVSDEKTPLLDGVNKPPVGLSGYKSHVRYLVKRIADALTALLATIGKPLLYVVSCFQDEDGRYSAIIPFKWVRRKAPMSSTSKSTATAVGLSRAPENQTREWNDEKPAKPDAQDAKLRRQYSTDSLRSTTSESESERRRTRSPKTATDEGPRRQSLRLKLYHGDTQAKRKSRNANTPDVTVHMPPPPVPLTVDTIKSPTSPSPSLKVTRDPRAPQPPRPLIPRRQPSYLNLTLPHISPAASPSSRSLTGAAAAAAAAMRSSAHQPQKTLILDLDETLIHSLAKGGRMSSGHMVEVKLNAPVALASPASLPLAPPASSSPSLGGLAAAAAAAPGGGPVPPTPNAILGPQHPILYYVHKRPHCEEFLRKVYKWYKLVIFTASVQEYADPVIDWLEQERKYFAGRYYRQHCTFRNGNYVKDLSSIEPDLSKVLILDNSPVSYVFHEGVCVSCLPVLLVICSPPTPPFCVFWSPPLAPTSITSTTSPTPPFCHASPATPFGGGG